MSQTGVTFIVMGIVLLLAIALHSMLNSHSRDTVKHNEALNTSTLHVYDVFDNIKLNYFSHSQTELHSLCVFSASHQI